MKGLITAGDPRHRDLPFQTITDGRGRRLPLVRLHLEEMARAGIEEVGIVHPQEDSARWESFFRGEKVRLIGQSGANGFGDAVLQGRSFVGDSAFCLVVCDHLFLSAGALSCVEQLRKVYEAHGKPVAAVQATHESHVTQFGVVGAEPLGQEAGSYRVTQVREKPTPTEAELNLRVAGNRAGYYLGFFGIHILEPDIFACLAAESAAQPGAFGLSPSLDQLARQGRLLAHIIDGRRFNLEADYGILHAQLALALSGPDREKVLADIVRLLAGQ